MVQDIHNAAGRVTLHALHLHVLMHFIRFLSNGNIDMFYGAAAVSGRIGRARTRETRNPNPDPNPDPNPNRTSR